jgi:predicted DNA-binding protein with PD1-like motif
VGCLSRARLRDASGVTVRELPEHMEIVSLTGTVSEARLHLHIALSRGDLSTVGGHLMDGCIVGTTAEVVLLALPDIAFGEQFDPETGYGELTVTACNSTTSGI